MFIYGAFGGIMYGLHDVGFIGGRLIESLPLGELPFGGLSPLALITIGALYLLGIMYFVGQGGFRRALSTGAPDEIELLALRRREERGAAKSGRKAGSSGFEAGKAEGSGGTIGPQEAEEARRVSRDGCEPEAFTHRGPHDPGAAFRGPHPHDPDAAFRGPHDPGAAAYRDSREPDAATYRDRFSKQMAAVRESFGLSAREAEVAELIARGNTVAHIAELLFVSENTVRTHSKRIYVKLGIHKRQELIELVESFDPEGR